MVYAFVLFWVALGLTVFFVAMRGGPRGARGALHSESKLANRLLIGVVVLVCAFGLAVPALVIAFNSADKASVAVGGVHLDAEQQQGRTLFARSCVTCHTLAAVNSYARIGPNLDILLPSKAPTVEGRRALVLSAILEGRARGKGQMPALLYQGREAESIADFVSAVAGH
jgi:mono/diheme cytochrome c family protein